VKELPAWARKECEKCHEDIAYITTRARARGVPKEMAVDYEPDPGRGGTVLVAQEGNMLVGNPVPPRQATAMRAAGVALRADHALTCRRRSGSHKRDA